MTLHRNTQLSLYLAPTPKGPSARRVAARALHASGRSGGNAQKVFVALSATALCRGSLMPTVSVWCVGSDHYVLYVGGEYKGKY